MNNYDELLEENKYLKNMNEAESRYRERAELRASKWEERTMILLALLICVTLSWCSRVDKSTYNEDMDATYEHAYSQGRAEGYDEGYSEGEDHGYEDGREAGYEEGESEGYSMGYNEGYDIGVEDGSKDRYAIGYDDGFETGYQACLFKYGIEE